MAPFSRPVVFFQRRGPPCACLCLNDGLSDLIRIPGLSFLLKFRSGKRVENSEGAG